jgi:hypothetical protein
MQALGFVSLSPELGLFVLSRFVPDNLIVFERDLEQVDCPRDPTLDKSIVLH